MAEIVESYADLAIERWGGTVRANPQGGRPRAGHDFRLCGCIVCADGREALGHRPLVPLFARRDWPEARP